MVDGTAPGLVLPDGEALPPRYSEDAIALAFSARHDGQLLYVPAWSHWVSWDGACWSRDETLRVFDLVRGMCREFATLAEAEEKNGRAIARGLTSAATIAAVERLSRSDVRHARSSDAFDVDAWELNTPGVFWTCAPGKCGHIGAAICSRR